MKIGNPVSVKIGNPVVAQCPFKTGDRVRIINSAVTGTVKLRSFPPVAVVEWDETSWKNIPGWDWKDLELILNGLDRMLELVP